MDDVFFFFPPVFIPFQCEQNVLAIQEFTSLKKNLYVRTKCLKIIDDIRIIIFFKSRTAHLNHHIIVLLCLDSFGSKTTGKILQQSLCHVFFFLNRELSIELMFFPSWLHSVNSEEGLWQSEHSAYYWSGGGEVQMAE